MKGIRGVSILVFMIAVSHTCAAPANDDQLDKATVNDVAVNSVSEEKKVILASQGSNAPTSTVQISGITTGANLPSSTPIENTPFKPQRTGSMFARFIDDIFQIPITVLQSVARLITNPFTQKKPEVVATLP
ncbi:hypothetical protein JTB14_000478 [Gonioctena quinquepunctata]|nr:hypothetical protein JTB14_000478 [Gonioctena quinquepunctata]